MRPNAIKEPDEKARQGSRIIAKIVNKTGMPSVCNRHPGTITGRTRSSAPRRSVQFEAFLSITDDQFRYTTVVLSTGTSTGIGIVITNRISVFETPKF